jgi:hypothetical protein
MNANNEIIYIFARYRDTDFLEIYDDRKMSKLTNKKKSCLRGGIKAIVDMRATGSFL